MKTTILFLLCAMFTCTALAQQGSCISAKQVSADYENKTVKFVLTWNGCSSTTTHLNRVWVFVDIQSVDATTGEKGVWTPASFTGKPTVQNADTLTVPGNTRGFYVTGENGESAIVTIQIKDAPAKFNWCAFATDYPPNIGRNDDGVYTLRGTQSFVVNGSTIAGKQTSGSVSSLTDATGCPGCIAEQNFKITGSSVTIPCCPNLTAVSGVCRDLDADNAFHLYCPPDVDLEIKKTDLDEAWNPTNNCGGNAGWRYPTVAEGTCMLENHEKLNWNSVGKGYYLNGRGRHVFCVCPCGNIGCNSEYYALAASLFFWECSRCIAGHGYSGHLVRCVR